VAINPFHGLRDHQFWRRAMTDPAPGQIEFVTRGAHISRDDKVMTLGSCFAQRLGQELRSFGLTLFNTEPPPQGLSAEEAQARQYGVYTARYGNVYTPRQALQLLQRALGLLPPPTEGAWSNNGRFVDALRPTIEPNGWATPEAVLREADTHLGYVRDAFAGCNWLVMTLGLTEAWRSRLDGTVYPVAPGVAGGSFDAEHHEFVNFSALEATTDLLAFIGLLHDLNPQAKVLLTVSPVSMIATYEPRHVWESTVVSKAALRVAADAAERRFSHVTYFPAYEIVTSPANNGRYYDDDLRQVSHHGIRQVMKAFRNAFLDGGPLLQQSDDRTVDTRSPSADGVICDEDLVARSLEVPSAAGV
jgi:hypothetical protein